MNNALSIMAVAALALSLAACGTDSDDTAVSGNQNNGQVDSGGGTDGVTDGGTDDGTNNGTDGGGETGGLANSALAVAQSRSDLSTLVQALETAGLADTLDQAGTFTVFAPSNIAFDRLFTELNLTPAQLFGDQALLNEVLNYHVLTSSLSVADIPLSRPVDTAQGSVFKVEMNSIQPIIFDGRGRLARVLETDLAASNAVIHVIDQVMLPANKNIVQLAQTRNDLTILAEAVVAAGLVESLSGPGPFTVLAPTNDAFIALLSELGLTKEQLLADTALLQKVLTYHVVDGAVYRAQIPFNQPVPTLQGETVQIDAQFPPQVTDARGRNAQITSIDTIVTNGVVHIMSRVILPSN